MTNSGDAAEQIVRMSLEGVEVAARITGTAAKEIALLLLAALKSPEKSAAGGLKLKGKTRLESMLKSGKPLEIFSVKERDLKTFVQEAKRYGIVYCVLRNSKNAPDGLCDIMVKADDAPKINRLVERFKFAAVDTARIESEVVRDMAERTADAPAAPSAPSAEAERDGETTPPVGTDPIAPEINDIDALLDELLGTDEGKTAPEMTEAEKSEADKVAADKAAGDKTAPDTPEPEKAMPEKPEPAKPKRSKGRKKEPAPAADAPIPPSPDERNTPDPLASGGQTPVDGQPPKTTPSEPSSGSRKTSETRLSSKPSVKEELREIAAGIKVKEADAPKREEPVAEKPKTSLPPAHRQPQNKRKSKKSKGR